MAPVFSFLLLLSVIPGNHIVDRAIADAQKKGFLSDNPDPLIVLRIINAQKAVPDGHIEQCFGTLCWRSKNNDETQKPCDCAAMEDDIASLKNYINRFEERMTNMEDWRRCEHGVGNREQRYASDGRRCWLFAREEQGNWRRFEENARRLPPPYPNPRRGR